MIDLNVPGPVPSFLEVYELVRAELRREGHPDTNFTIRDKSNRIVGLQEVQQGGQFIIEPTSKIHSNPAQPYEFVDFYSPVRDYRGNNYPQLLPKNITPTMFNDMIEQYGLFEATCNLISALNTPKLSKSQAASVASIELMRARISSPADAKPGGVLNNPVDRIASPVNIIAGQEAIIDAETDRRLKEYFAEEGYSIQPMAETRGSGAPEDPFLTTYSMSSADQYFDNHRLPARYQTSEELFFKFCHFVLSPFLVSDASATQFMKHMTQEVIPSLQRDIDSSEVRGEIARAMREVSNQSQYLFQRIATDPKDFYYGREMALLVHPVFLVPHMRYVILPPSDLERENADRYRPIGETRANRRRYVTRAQRLLREAGRPPNYSQDGDRILADYDEAEGGGNFVLFPLHHQQVIGPGNPVFSYEFIRDRLRNMDIPGMLRGLFTVQESENIAGTTQHSPEIYVEAARRVFQRANMARTQLIVDNARGGVNNRQFAMYRPGGAANYRQTGEMVREPMLGPYTVEELEATDTRKRRVYNMAALKRIVRDLGAPDPGGNARQPYVDAIINFQNDNNIVPLGVADYNRALNTVISGTPIVYEVDLPGMHPLPIGWPEPMIFSMMEMLAKYRDHITGLNGNVYSADEFLSPKISSGFRFDETATVDITYYDPGIARNRRFGLTYGMLRDIAEGNYQDVGDARQTQNWATAMAAFMAQLTGIDMDAVKQNDVEYMQDVFAYMSTMQNENNVNRIPANMRGSDIARFADINHPFHAFDAYDINPPILQAEGFFPDEGEGDNDVLALFHMARRYALIETAKLYIPDFFRIASQNGVGIINLDVETSSGLSSMFVLREIIRHSKSAYNYTPSADDVTFTYLLMVWCLENCLGQSVMREEKEGLEGVIGRVWQTLQARDDERFDQLNAEVLQQLAAVNGPHQLAVIDGLIALLANRPLQRRRGGF